MCIKKIYLCGLITIVLSITALQAQEDSPERYRRSSLYSVLIKYPDKAFAAAIEEVFKSIPIPEKFDTHDLQYKVIRATPPRKKAEKGLPQKENTKSFENANAIGRRLVAKWFNYDEQTGTFDMELIFERGLYDASFSDIKTAQADVRGYAKLRDAGVELIGNTFVVFNDIQYINKTDKGAIAALVLALIGIVAEGVSDVTKGKTSDISKLASATSFLGAKISNQIAGFSVEVTSYLYRLDWTEEIAETFYQNYYNDSENLSAEKSNAFNRDRKTFTLTYEGAHTVQSGKTTLKGVSTNEDMIRKVCTHAIDKSIAELQRKYDVFKVKTPLYSTAPITAKVGVKEGVTEKSKFEVLEIQEDENGRTSYKRVGIIKPVKDKIWDNRYLAVEDGFKGADLGATEFKKISGSDFYPGMLIREIR